MPDFIEVCVPLIFGTFRNPAASPISSPPGKVSFGNRLQTALVQRTRAIGNAAATLEMLAHVRMGLEALHLIERRQPGVAVVQADHEAERDQVLAEMIKERTAIDVGAQRPAQAVLDQARLVIGGGNFPQLLDPDRVGLRILALAQVEPRHQLLGQRAAAALGEQRVFRPQFHAALVGIRSPRRLCRCPCRRWRCRRCGHLPPAIRWRRSRDRSRRPALRPAGPASAPRCRGTRCSCRDCASAAASAA